VAGARRVMMIARTEMRADTTIHSLTPQVFINARQKTSKMELAASCCMQLSASLRTYPAAAHLRKNKELSLHCSKIALEQLRLL